MSKSTNSYNLLWKSSNLKLNFKNIYRYLPSKINLLLLSDGSFTKLLETLLGDLIQVNFINNYKIKHCMSYQEHSCNFVALRIHRRCWLLDRNGCKLLFASSWYVPKLSLQCQTAQLVPLGKIFVSSELILYRRLHCIACLHSKHLQEQFNTQENIWTREYILYNKQQPFILIKELFSPRLIRYFLDT
uniref:Chorismate lyase n=1 Tax=Hildenbrandia rivularis TaxID=135206 RepID=A0A1C9CFF3_9FLOR|nr:hypothetical protein Hrvl_056 [Hildenbrandia rivularis]AOM67116.1 hypothetical protein Hrvl_056 [Hildenbrandia rivularis]